MDDQPFRQLDEVPPQQRQRQLRRDRSPTTALGVRDSKNPLGGVLEFPPAAGRASSTTSETAGSTSDGCGFSTSLTCSCSLTLGCWNPTTGVDTSPIQCPSVLVRQGASRGGRQPAASRTAGFVLRAWRRRLRRLRTADVPSRTCRRVQRGAGRERRARRRAGLDASTIGAYEQGSITWPNADYRAALRAVFAERTARWASTPRADQDHRLTTPSIGRWPRRCVIGQRHCDHRVDLSDLSAAETEELIAYLRDQWHLLVRADNLLGPRHALSGVDPARSP